MTVAAEAGLGRQTRALLERLAAQPFPDITTLPPDEMRAAHAAFFASVGLEPDPALADAGDVTVHAPGREIPVRVYTPRDRAGEPRPLLVYLHGGGMVAGSIESYDAVCRRLAHGAGALVASVGYRLAPEDRFPAAVDDAWAALEWTLAHAGELGADPTRVAVGGDSAGGNLAAVVAQQARDHGLPLAFQLLIYPAVGTLGHSRSMAQFASGYLFERAEYDWLYQQYLDDPAQARDPRVSPILAPDLSGLAPALIVTAGFDIMRDDAETYAERLREAGVPATVRRFEGTIHAFVSMAGVLDDGRQAIDECAAALRHAFAAARTVENDHVRIAREDAATAGPGVVIDLATGAARYEAGPLPAASGGPREVRVELRRPPGAAELGDLDAVRVEPERYRVVLERDDVRVVRLRFDPGEQGEMVAHPPRALVTLTDVAVRLRFADGRTDERAAPAGVAGWLDAETLQTTNAGGAPLEVVLVEPKPTVH